MCCHPSEYHVNGVCRLCGRRLGVRPRPAFWVENAMLVAIVFMVAGLVLFGARKAHGQPIPTTQPVDDQALLRVREQSGTLVVIQTCFKSGYDPATDTLWSAAWHDSFVWRPGHAWVPVYGWEVAHLSDDGRWVLLHRNGEKPKLQAVHTLLANARQVTFLQVDLTRDGKVDQADFAAIQLQLGKVGPWSGDLNRDGCVDNADVELFDMVRQQMSR